MVVEEVLRGQACRLGITEVLEKHCTMELLAVWVGVSLVGRTLWLRKQNSHPVGCFARSILYSRMCEIIFGSQDVRCGVEVCEFTMRISQRMLLFRTCNHWIVDYVHFPITPPGGLILFYCPPRRSYSISLVLQLDLILRRVDTLRAYTNNMWHSSSSR